MCAVGPFYVLTLTQSSLSPSTSNLQSSSKIGQKVSVLLKNYLQVPGNKFHK